MKKFLALVFILYSTVACAAQTAFLQVPAWSNISTTTRYPTVGTYDVSDVSNIGGIIGLYSGSGAVSHGVVTFFWTLDSAGTEIVGVQGMNLSSLIVSTNQLRLPNLGPYVYITYKPIIGPNQIAVKLFGTNDSNRLPEIPGDTILIDESRTLAAHTAVTFYPDDYYAGWARVYLNAPAGVTATIYGADLTDQFWPLDQLSNGSMTTITPLGTWLVVVYNSNPQSVTYSIEVTPMPIGR